MQKKFVITITNQINDSKGDARKNWWNYNLILRKKYKETSKTFHWCVIEDYYIKFVQLYRRLINIRKFLSKILSFFIFNETFNKIFIINSFSFILNYLIKSNFHRFISNQSSTQKKERYFSLRDQYSQKIKQGEGNKNIKENKTIEILFKVNKKEIKQCFVFVREEYGIHVKRGIINRRLMKLTFPLSAVK